MNLELDLPSVKILELGYADGHRVLTADGLQALYEQEGPEVSGEGYARKAQ